MEVDDGIDGAADDDFDLTDVPMDDAPDAELGGDEGGQEPEGQEQEQQEQQRAPLEPAELQRRYENSRVALQEERRERRALQTRLTELEARVTGGSQQQREVIAEAPIDPETDPLGALKQALAKIDAYEAQGRKEGETQAQREAQNRRDAAVEANLADHEADFRDLRPDYDVAAKHYTTARAQELGEIGLAPPQIAATLRQEFIALAQRAIQAGKNPAAVVYKLAEGRGYKVGQGGQQQQQQARDESGRFKPGGKLDQLAAGQRASNPLNKPGGSARTGLDARSVGNINIRDKKGGEAFDRAFAALERQAKAAER